MSEELKPCPFCGNTNVSIIDKDLYYQASCEGCYASTLEAEVRDYAVTKWNTRHTPEGYALIELDSVLVPRGKPMPQTVEAWQYLGHQYEKELLANRDEIAALKAKVNDLAQKLRGKDGYALVPVEVPSNRPPYGIPILVAIRGTWQHVTYMRDGSDDSDDWVEPYHFDHDDNTRAWWKEVTAWVLVDNLPEITAAQEGKG